MDEEEIRRSAALKQRHWWYSGGGPWYAGWSLRCPPAGPSTWAGARWQRRGARDLGWRVTGASVLTVTAAERRAAEA